MDVQSTQTTEPIVGGEITQSVPDTRLSIRLKEAWEKRCNQMDLEEAEIQFFKAHATQNTPKAYVEKFKAACEQQTNSSYVFKCINGLEPLQKMVELFLPAAATIVQAYPNPGSLILGGIVGLLEITKRLQNYQRQILKMLVRMGRKAAKLEAYENQVYRHEEIVQIALVNVYGSIVEFCHKAFKFLTKNGELRAKVKGFRLLLFHDFDSHLESYVAEFEDNLDIVEDNASICDKKRTQQVLDSQTSGHEKFRQLKVELKSEFQRRDEWDWKNWNINREADKELTREKQALNRKKQLEWLSPLSFRGLYDEKRHSHLAGTGYWLIDSALYKDWRSSNRSDLLWVRGKPGCGKSHLAAVSIADSESYSGPLVPLAFAFCRKADESSQSFVKIFGALVQQICAHVEGTNSALQDKYTRSLENEHPTLEALRNILASVQKGLQETYIIIDGMDECEESAKLTEELLRLVEGNSPSPVKVIIFSREDDFNLQKLLKGYEQLHPDQGPNEEDLKSYINERFPDEIDPKYNRQIRDEFLKKAEGMFLWVNLAADNLEKEPLTGKQKLLRLEKIPPKLERLYNQILEDIGNQADDVRVIAYYVLLWVLYSRRPLTGKEMLEAVANFEDIECYDELSLHPSEQHLIVLCGNLVTIDMYGYFQICHESVSDHLKKAGENSNPLLAEYQILSRNAHERLAEVCLTYLLLTDFECGPARTRSKLYALTRKYEFLEYAADSWGWHLSRQGEQSLQQLVLKMISSSPRRELSIQLALHMDDDNESFHCLQNTSNNLHILSLFGLKYTAALLLDKGMMLTVIDDSGRSPINYALYGNHHDLVKWLTLETGLSGQQLTWAQKCSTALKSAVLGWTDILEILIRQEPSLVNAKVIPRGYSALSVACACGQEKAAAVLLDHRANPNGIHSEAESPLIISTSAGHTGLVSMLLKAGANIETKDPNDWTPLICAIEKRNVALVKLLLSYDADGSMPLPKFSNQTALHFAAELNEVEIIKCLSHVLPNLNKTSEDQNTALHIAAWHNSWNAAAELLQLGALPNELTSESESALYIAAQAGHLETVQVLLRNKCATDTITSSGRTVLHAAASSGNLAVFRAFGSDIRRLYVNTTSRSGEAPLHVSIESGNDEIVRLLIKSGAEVLRNGFLKSSPLHYAAHFNQRAISYRLLKRSKEANPRNEDNETPLHFAARANNFGFIEGFYEDCASLGLSIDTEALSTTNKTPLHTALGNGYKDIAQFILQKGFTSSPTSSGSYQIHEAAWHGCDQIISKILSHEGVTSKGFFGRTPLICAASRGHLSSVKLISEHSNDVLDEKDDSKSTALHLAIKFRHLDVANHLLQLKAKFDTRDEYDSTLLHSAAGIGDLPMVQSLLDLGLRADATNTFGETPFHLATTSGSIGVIDALVRSGVNEINRPTRIGATCSLIAAEIGDVDLLKRIQEHGGIVPARDFLGHTTAFYAAENGHLEMLEHLKKCGENLGTLDAEGVSVLMTANGHPNVITYLIGEQRRQINHTSTWSKASALTNAAIVGFSESMKLLLAAGADPFHYDGYGIHSFDFAMKHTAAARVMREAGFFNSPPGTADQLRQRNETIRTCCERMLSPPSDQSIETLFRGISQELLLGNTLRIAKDWESMKVVMMNIMWPVKGALLQATFRCEICAQGQIEGNRSVCTSCHRAVVLCDNCHEDFQKAKKKLPDGAKTLIDLEHEVQKVRDLFTDNWILMIISQAMHYFKTSREWIQDSLLRYDTWEETHNKSGKYTTLPRPGQKFLKAIKAFYMILEKDWDDLETTTEALSRIATIQKEFEASERKSRADAETKQFSCEGHDFILISADERGKLKSEGRLLDSDTGKLTAYFLEEVLAKYSQATRDARPQPDPISQISRFSPLRETENATQETFPTRVQRSNSFSHLAQALGEIRTSSTRGIETPISTSSSMTMRHPRRSQTLPIISVSRSTGSRSLKIGMKNTVPVTDLQAQIDARVKGTAVPSPVTKMTEHITGQTVHIPITVDEADGLNAKPISQVSTTEPITTSIDSVPSKFVNERRHSSQSLSSDSKADLGIQNSSAVENLKVNTSLFHARDNDSTQHERTNIDPSALFRKITKRVGNTHEVAIWWSALGIANIISPGFMSLAIQEYLVYDEDEQSMPTGNSPVTYDSDNDDDDDDDDNDSNNDNKS